MVVFCVCQVVLTTACTVIQTVQTDVTFVRLVTCFTTQPTNAGVSFLFAVVITTHVMHYRDNTHKNMKTGVKLSYDLKVKGNSQGCQLAECELQVIINPFLSSHFSIPVTCFPLCSGAALSSQGSHRPCRRRRSSGMLTRTKF